MQLQMEHHINGNQDHSLILSSSSHSSFGALRAAVDAALLFPLECQEEEQDELDLINS